MSVTAEFDRSNISRVIFSEPVTLAAASQFLWGRTRPEPPTLGPALTPDPDERSASGRYRRFLIRNDASLYTELVPANLAQEFTRRGGPQVVHGPPVSGSDFPAWLPTNVRRSIEGHSIHDGVTRFRGPAPWGDVVVWQHSTGPFRDVQYYLEFPTSLEFWVNIAGGDRPIARLLQRVYVQWNGDLSYFVEQRGMSPVDARHELMRINLELFREVIKSALVMLNFVGVINISVSAMRSFAQRVAQASQNLQPSRRGLPPVRQQQRPASMTSQERDQIFQSGGREDNVYMGGPTGRQAYAREWQSHGGTGEPPQYGFQVRDANGRVVRRVGFRSQDEPITPARITRGTVLPPSEVTPGAGGTLLESVDRERITELVQLFGHQRTPGRFVPVPGGPHNPNYLAQWIEAGGQRAPPAEGFAVWSAELDDVLRLVIPHNR